MMNGIVKYITNTGRRLGRPDILFYTLPWLMVLIVLGTVAQKEMGLFEATHIYFSSFIFMIGIVPLPAGYSVLTLLTINLVCHLVFFSPWRREKIGIHISHIAIIILLIGGLLTAVTMKEGFMVLKPEDTKDSLMAFNNGEMFVTPDMMENNGDATLPFSLTLNNFRREVYPGTGMPKLYESYVTITDGDLKWPAVISMNEPLRYGGYTFYQASTFVTKNGVPISVLNVVQNDGWLFPYIAGILLALGLIVHMIVRKPRAFE